MKTFRLPQIRPLVSLTILIIVSLACATAPVETVPPTPTATIAPPTATPLPTNTPLPTPKPIPTVSELSKATVQVLAMVDGEIQWWGSGTIISSDGLILTNAHVADPQAPGLALFYEDLSLAFTPPPDQIVIAVVESESRPPVQKYVAEVVNSDGALDLAILRIVTDIDENPVDVESLGLPFVELGDSDTVNLGETVKIFGFPGIGGETITFTQGTVSGFESQENVGERAFIKTDTEIAPGNSGGLAVDEMGQIIGVPTLTVSSDSGSVIARLRSINLAKSMVEAAVAKTKYESKYAKEGTGQEGFNLTGWSEDYDESGCPIKPVERYPSGALAIVSTWSYKEMANGEDFIALYFHNHEYIFSDFFAWEEGSSDKCYALYLDYGGYPMPEGDYQIEIYAGKGYPLIASADTSVGPIKTGDVKLQGMIYDTLTYAGIPNASLVVLNPGIDPYTWLDDPNENDIFTRAQTDQEGNYATSVKLERQVDYPIVVAAEGYYSYAFYWRIGMADDGSLWVGIEPR